MKRAREKEGKKGELMKRSTESQGGEKVWRIEEKKGMKLDDHIWTRATTKLYMLTLPQPCNTLIGMTLMSLM